jgi:hypothetical protein
MGVWGGIAEDGDVSGFAVCVGVLMAANECMLM